MGSPTRYVEVLTTIFSKYDFGNRVVSDVISQDEIIGAGLNPNDWYLYKKRKDDMKSDPQGKGQVMMD